MASGVEPPSAAALRRYSSASYTASWTSAGSAPANAERSSATYPSMVSAIMPPLQSGIDVVARMRPHRLPFGEHGSSEVRDRVVLPRGTRHARLHPASQQPLLLHGAQHRVQRALLDRRPFLPLSLIH